MGLEDDSQRIGPTHCGNTPLMVIPLSAWMEGDRPPFRSIMGGLWPLLE